MDRQEIQSTLRDALEAEVPSASIHLWPRIEAGFAAGNTQPRKTMHTALRRIAFTAAAIGVLCAFVLLTPPGRAFAQRMFQFFTTTGEKSFQIPTEQVLPAPATPTPPPAQTLPLESAPANQPTHTATPDAACISSASQGAYVCQVNAAEAQAGFNAKEFPYDPKGMKFSAVTFTASTGEISMEFVVKTGGGYVYLRQGISDFPEQNNAWGEIPADAVEQTSVNGNYAEIASGGYMVYPNATEAVWEPDAGLLRLAWKEGNHWFVIEKMGDPYPIEWITKDQLIRLAEGLVEDRPIDAVPPLDPQYLSTVEQAETLAGFDIPTPSLLPAGYELKRVVWENDTAYLMYGPKGSPESELFINLGLIADNPQAGACSECPAGAVEAVQVGPWQGWYWRGIFESFASSTAGQPTPTPTWNGDAFYWTLTWNTDQFWFGIAYSPAYNSGKETNKELLIQIAESMK